MPIYILEHQRFLIFSSIKTKIPLSCVLNKVHIKCITISHDAELQTLNYKCPVGNTAGAQKCPFIIKKKTIKLSLVIPSKLFPDSPFPELGHLHFIFLYPQIQHLLTLITLI